MALDFVQEVDTLKSFAETFVLCPWQWDTFSPPTELRWRCLKFCPSNRSRVPSHSGIYAFVVRKQPSAFPPHGYIMYVGMAGRDGGGSLQARYSNYFSEKRTLKRPKVHYMLNKWAGHLYFYYAPIKKTACDIHKLEQHLCDAIIPPCNINDFSARIRSLVGAFNS